MSGLGSFLRRLQGDPLEAVADAELVGRFLNRHDAAAFEALVRRHGLLVLRVCQRELARLADAEDAFQATFLVLAQKAGRIRKLDALPAWLSGVARRLSRRLAQQLRGRRGKLATLARRGTPAPAADVPVWWDEERRRLPEEYRTVIDLCLIQGLTREEAAMRLGQSPSAVHGLLYRARLKLKKQLLDHGAVPGSLLLGAQSAGAAVDRMAPALAQAAVRWVQHGAWPREQVAAQALWLVQRGAMPAWLVPGLVASGLAVGGGAWSGWQFSRTSDGRNPVVARATSPAETRFAPLTGNDSQQQDHLQGINQARWQQENIRQGAPEPWIPNQPPRQTMEPPLTQQRSQASGPGQLAIPSGASVPPADRVPNLSERGSLAQTISAAAGTLSQDRLRLLPHQEKLTFDGKDVVVSVITSEMEYQACSLQSQTVKGQVPDPVWNGGTFRPDWTKHVLVAVVMAEPNDQAVLTPLSECWIPPDAGGVGHLLLSYAGAEPVGKFPGQSRHPYVMVLASREGLKRIAVSIWRPGEKPAGAVVVPARK